MIVLIALLAIVRKLMIIDLSATDANQLFALSSAILALGGVFWLVRDQDRPDRDEKGSWGFGVPGTRQYLHRSGWLASE